MGLHRRWLRVLVGVWVFAMVVLIGQAMIAG